MILRKAISHPQSFMNLIPSITSLVACTLLSLQVLIQRKISPFFLEMQLVRGTLMATNKIPSTPGQPSRIMRRTVAPMAKIGKENELRKMLSLIQMTPKSLANKFVIFPSCKDLITYEVREEILPQRSIARAALIFAASTQDIK